MIRRTLARCHVARGIATAVLGVLATGRVATGQGGGWVATPDHPTVGDTVWLDRFVAAPPGWRVQARRVESGPSGGAEFLGDAIVRRTGAGWLVRYPVVAWAPATYLASPPAILKLAPDGRVDSLPRDTASFRVWSVIPDSVVAPQPKPLLPPQRARTPNPLPVGIAVLGAGGLLLGVVRWRRRRPRPLPPPPQVPLEPEVPDARWLAAGEPKAVAVRAVQRLRLAVARVTPEAHPALSTAECLAAVARGRPDAPLRELGDLLEQLDRVAFASAHGTDVAALAKMANRLAREIGGGAR